MQNNSKALLLLAMVITLMTIVFQLIYEKFPTEPLSYQRTYFLSKLYWQWLTPSLVHANWNHWLLNIVNFYGILIVFFQAWSFKKVLFLFSISSLFITLSLYICLPNLNSYVGMSGVLYTLIVYGGLYTFSKQKIVSGLILLYVLLKLWIPDIINNSIGINTMLNGLHILTEAHFYGAVVGVGGYVFGFLLPPQPQNNPH